MTTQETIRVAYRDIETYLEPKTLLEVEVLMAEAGSEGSTRPGFWDDAPDYAEALMKSGRVEEAEDINRVLQRLGYIAELQARAKVRTKP